MQHLCTWTCGHFVILQAAACLPTSALQHDAVEGFWFLSDSAEDELANTAAERHVAFEDSCPNCADTEEYPSLQRLRALKDVRTLRSLYNTCKSDYLTSAGRYHFLDFSQKAKYAEDSRCKSAHEQFWISSTPRREDPFFGPFTTLANLIDEAQTSLLATSSETEDLATIFGTINEARAALGRALKTLHELTEAVDLMSQAPNKETYSAEDANGLRSREHMANNLRTEAFWMRMEEWVAEAGTAMMAALEYGW